jgi:Flp pilus assembly protein TadD
MHQRLAPLIAAVGLLLCMAARADEVAEVDRLYRAGQTQEAFARAERHLAAQPQDAQMRFLRGVMLADAKRTDEALDVFRRLTEDFPELPEPYNNLAVIYAERGQYDKAREALETSVRNNPGYGTALQNLGDIYAELARQAYAKALGNTPGGAPASAELHRKLSLMRELLAPRGAAKAGS